MILRAPIRLQDDAVERSGSARGASTGRDGVDLQANLHLEKKNQRGMKLLLLRKTHPISVPGERVHSGTEL